MSHHDTLDTFTHQHDFLGTRHERNARRTWSVVALTAAMMVVEIVAGWWTGSMALLADGLHMATHAGALSLAGFAYWFARRHRHNPRFTFGTGKVGDLAGFSSALILALIALGIGVESALRLAQPVHIAYDEALWIAALGLLVNLLSAWMLGADHHHDHGHSHGHGHGHGDHHDHDHDEHAHAHHDGHDHDHAHAHDHHHPHDHHGHAHAHAAHAHSHDRHAHADHNLRSAYMHVLADALTSVMAIVALLLAKYLGWTWTDALMGIVGAIVIARWSLALLRDTGAVLLDASAPAALQAQIRDRLQQDDERIADLHVWRVGPGQHAAIVSLVTHKPRPAAFYHARLQGVATLGHVSIEVQTCPH
ncbi:CDF family Co(II)/Ni(II) efflux transporter DmeF [Xanthomonas sacchari]|uniref:Zinc transporter ZitB n=1 Tax=Xanthomonas sacchari TaxID=56458 RepID=A0ABT3DW78_9XANT|nr:CDF family Co(II)/Ni(II) efflux transporter DmeF [Xanthomonas sacchari]MCW0399743.1 Zinc transporter ZitB [Xanthomonas sacchari]MCW0420752.1 Zinc transporter ZitB [Xanthomonas sacchari]MCW0424126.1 Zinc transporter ZitB [Xanthomonas sacchari]UYK70812.1 CDF family Co(II)/Ni(II) efflux transporter DmeF [Xanthomonas sacchari]